MAKNTSRPPNPRQKVATLKALQQVNRNAAGVGIGDDAIFAAVPAGRSDVSVKVFHPCTADLSALADRQALDLLVVLLPRP